MENLPKIVKNHLKLIFKKKAKNFCKCGVSSKDPYCNVSHKGTGFYQKL